MKLLRFFFLALFLVGVGCSQTEEVFQPEFPEFEEMDGEAVWPGGVPPGGQEGDTGLVGGRGSLPPGGDEGGLDLAVPEGLGDVVDRVGDVVDPRDEGGDGDRDGEDGILEGPGEVREESVSPGQRKIVVKEPSCEGPLQLQTRYVMERGRELTGSSPFRVTLGSPVVFVLDVSGGRGPYKFTIEGTTTPSFAQLLRPWDDRDSWSRTSNGRAIWVGNALRYHPGTVIQRDLREEVFVSVTDEGCQHLASTTKYVRLDVIRPRDKLKNLWFDLLFSRRITSQDRGYVELTLYMNDEIVGHAYWDLISCHADRTRCTYPKKVTLGPREFGNYEAYGELYLGQINQIQFNIRNSDVRVDTATLFSPFWIKQYTNVDMRGGSESGRFLPITFWEPTYAPFYDNDIEERIEAACRARDREECSSGDLTAFSE